MHPDFSHLIVGSDSQVPVLGGNRVRYAFLDHAASTPPLRSVLERVNKACEWYASVHRGTGAKSLVSTALYDEAHETVARFVGADLTHHAVIFGMNTTTAVNKLARRLALRPDDVVAVSFLEHHSNDLPWRACGARRAVIEIDAQGRIDLDSLADVLRISAGRVKLVAVSAASNVTGYITPIREVARMTHEAGAMLFVDAAQLAPHRAIEMGPPGGVESIDAIAFSAHKMYAPFGTGVLVAPSSVLDAGAPDQPGGGTVSIVSEDEVVWAHLPDREEPGSPNVLGAIALAAAVEALERIGMDSVAAHEERLMKRAIEGLSAIDGVELYGDAGDLSSRVGVVPFNVRGKHNGMVAAALSAEYGIGVRNGCFCAHPYVTRLLGVAPEESRAVRERVKSSDRTELPGLVRASFGLAARMEDVSRLIGAVGDVVAGRLGGEYHEDARGVWHCKGFEPDVAALFSDAWDRPSSGG